MSLEKVDSGFGRALGNTRGRGTGGGARRPVGGAAPAGSRDDCSWPTNPRSASRTTVSPACPRSKRTSPLADVPHRPQSGGGGRLEGRGFRLRQGQGRQTVPVEGRRRRGRPRAHRPGPPVRVGALPRRRRRAVPAVSAPVGLKRRPAPLPVPPPTPTSSEGTVPRPRTFARTRRTGAFMRGRYLVDARGRGVRRASTFSQHPGSASARP